MASQTPDTSRAVRMEACLRAEFAPVDLVVEDESARHAGHAGARAGGETHYAIRLVSDRFTGKGRVERSRMVHSVLADEFAHGLHALALHLRTPSEM
jgi:BolA protein